MPKVCISRTQDQVNRDARQFIGLGALQNIPLYLENRQPPESADFCSIVSAASEGNNFVFCTN